jgi:GDP-4-dehydro-6-deoxy-D-mannose reductase
MRCLITGITGFVGPHLAELLKQHGHEVIGTASRSSPERNRLAYEVIPVDIGDHDAVLRVIREVKPERVYHLAAQSSPRLSLERPAETFRSNLDGTINLLVALHEVNSSARVLLAGSIGSYGIPRPENLPIMEEHPFAPRNPYAASKAAADLTGYQWWAAYGLHVVRTRASQHTGPGQTAEFVCSDWARQIAAIDAGLAEPVLRVGNINVKRDFCDVRDVVRAYELLLESGRPGEAYNVGSGHATALSDIIELLVACCRVPISVTAESDRLRADDPAATYLSIEKIQRDTGWTPELPLSTTLRDLYRYWQNVLHGASRELAAD